MKDHLNKALKFIDHYRYTFICVIMAIVVLGLVNGCNTTTASIIDPDKEVTYQGLKMEAVDVKSELAGEKARLDAMIARYNNQVDAFNAKLEAAQADLERQEQIKAELFSLGGKVVTSAIEGTVDPASLVGTGITALALALGLGASADNLRKDKKIEGLKGSSKINPPAA